MLIGAGNPMVMPCLLHVYRSTGTFLVTVVRVALAAMVNLLITRLAPAFLNLSNENVDHLMTPTRLWKALAGTVLIAASVGQWYTTALGYVFVLRQLWPVLCYFPELCCSTHGRSHASSVRNHVLLTVHICRKLTGACNPMLCPCIPRPQGDSIAAPRTLLHGRRPACCARGWGLGDDRR